MRDFLRTVRLMLTISWHADAARSIGALVTSSGQYVVLPLHALGLKFVVDGIVTGNGLELVGVAVIVTAGAFNRLMSWASLNLRMRLREHTQLYLDTYLMGLTAGIPGIEHHELPEYLNAVERLRTERPYLANPFNPISWTLASTLQALVVLGLFAGVAPVFAFLPLLALPAAIATAHAEDANIKVADAQAEQARTLRHLFDLATEPAPAKEVRIYGLGDELLARRQGVFGAMEAERRHLSSTNVNRIAATWLVFAAGYAAALAWAIGAARNGRLTVGDVALVLTLGAQLNNQLAELAFNVAWFSRSRRAVRRLVWFRDYASSARRPFELPASAAPPSQLSHGIDIDGVRFSYPGSDRPILAAIDLHLPAGVTVALVGENGSGKTTLVKLLSRMYEPTEGCIRADGVDIASFDVAAWRRRISAGFQDFARFELVARESVGSGDVHNDLADDDIAEALQRAVAADLATSLSAGLDTQLGRQFDGAELSLGQWQKIALGRAMVRKSPLLLVLDEPTASLDAPTEHALFERFAGAAKDVAATSGGVTLLISHRFSTVRMADLIVVLVDGQIAEAGDHNTLLQANGTYAELYRLQARAYRVH